MKKSFITRGLQSNKYGKLLFSQKRCQTTFKKNEKTDIKIVDKLKRYIEKMVQGKVLWRCVISDHTISDLNSLVI